MELDWSPTATATVWRVCVCVYRFAQYAEHKLIPIDLFLYTNPTRQENELGWHLLFYSPYTWSAK